MLVKLQAELLQICFFGILSNISDEINVQEIFWGEPILDENLSVAGPVFFIRFVHINVEADYFFLVKTMKINKNRIYRKVKLCQCGNTV